MSSSSTQLPSFFPRASSLRELSEGQDRKGTHEKATIWQIQSKEVMVVETNSLLPFSPSFLRNDRGRRGRVSSKLYIKAPFPISELFLSFLSLRRDPSPTPKLPSENCSVHPCPSSIHIRSIRHPPPPLAIYCSPQIPPSSRTFNLCSSM